MLPFEIDNLYERLNRICDEIIADDIWDNSNNAAFEISSLLKIYQKNVCRPSGSGKRYERQLNAISKFEYVLKRLEYFNDHKEDVEFHNVRDCRECCNFENM